MDSNLELDMTILSAGVKAGMWDVFVAEVRKIANSTADMRTPAEPFYAELVEEIVFNTWPEIEKGLAKRQEIT